MKLTDQTDMLNSVASSTPHPLKAFESSLNPHNGNKKASLVGKIIRVEITEEMVDLKRKRAAQFLVFLTVRPMS